MLQVNHADTIAIALFVLMTGATSLASAQESEGSEPDAPVSEGTTEAPEETSDEEGELAEETEESSETDEKEPDENEPDENEPDEKEPDQTEPEEATPEAAEPYVPEEGPVLPDGMTLDETLDRAGQPPPEDFPVAVGDEKVYAFLLGEMLEYRLDPSDAHDVIGWELQGWLGGDFNKLWIKHEGEGVYESPGTIESETDVLYARLITPFWNAQIGAQYAQEWTTSNGDYEDRWSGALAIQGMAPGSFEIDLSLYLSQDADFTIEVEAEYDIRITQRLVLQPLVGLGFSIQEIPDRAIGAGMTDANIDLRLRYEIKREFAPYIGARWHRQVGQTADIARAAGEDPSRWFLIAGIRFALL